MFCCSDFLWNVFDPFQPNVPLMKQHIHGKNFRDYPKWKNAIMLRIILKILEAMPRQEQWPRIWSGRQSRAV